MRIANQATVETEVDAIIASVAAFEDVTENYDFAFGETSGEVIDFATRQRLSFDD